MILCVIAPHTHSQNRHKDIYMKNITNNNILGLKTNSKNFE